jgi:hypothetical protein
MGGTAFTKGDFTTTAKEKASAFRGGRQLEYAAVTWVGNPQVAW